MREGCERGVGGVCRRGVREGCVGGCVGGVCVRGV